MKKTWSILSPTSMGVRLTPVDSQPVHCSNTFTMQATSAETNALSVCSSLDGGLSVKVLTCFVKDSPIARLIKDNLKSRNIAYEAAELAQGNPWGYRHQFNIADSGFGVRGPIVYNDRAGEVGRELNVGQFDIDRIFGEEGVELLHMSGLIASLSPKTAEFCLELTKKAKQYGAQISFDLNYRKSFWQNREAELRDTFSQIAEHSDILIGNEEEFRKALGIDSPGVTDLSANIGNFKEMLTRVKSTYPNLRIIATTLREVVSANVHKWGSIMFDGEQFDVIQPREIGVLDRIGGGDGFVGGMLYGLLKGYDIATCNRLGWAAGALAVTLLTDYCLPINEKQLLGIFAGNARVKR